MKVSILTRDIKISKEISNIKKAANIAFKEKSDLLVLPSYHPCPNNSTSYLGKIKEISNEYNINLLVDTPTNTFLVKPHTSHNIEFIQYFAKGNDKKMRYEELSKTLLENKRDFKINKTKLRVLLCGENNYFKNQRNNPDEMNKVKIRYDDLYWDNDYDILINPAHSTMGQWNLLNKRFSKLSTHNRLVIFTTNKGKTDCGKTEKTVKSWNTTLRVYKNGELLINGELKSNTGKPYIDHLLRLVTIEI